MFVAEVGSLLYVVGGLLPVPLLRNRILHLYLVSWGWIRSR